MHVPHNFLPRPIGGPTTTAPTGPAATVKDPVDALTKGGQNLVDSAQALAGVWMLLVIMGIGVYLLARRGAKLTATAGIIVIVVLASILIFSPDWVLAVVRGLGIKVTG